MISTISDNDYILTLILGFTVLIIIIMADNSIIRLAYRTLGRDIGALRKYAIMYMNKMSYEFYETTIPKAFRQTCKKFPDKIMLISAETGETWTFQEVEEYSNRIANYVTERGFVRGDVIALMVINQPKYVGILLGLAKVGIVTSLINTNLRGDVLKTTIHIANSKAIIFDEKMEEALTPISSDLKTPTKEDQFKFFSIHTSSKIPTTDLMDSDLYTYSSKYKMDKLGKTKGDYVYIYTSGTTGMPKAAHGDHMRYLLMATIPHYFAGLNKEDRIYTCLPLFHSSALWFGIGPAITNGTSVVIRSKFSASNFWKDIVKYEATATQHIGEICRFLLAQTPNEFENSHKLKVMYGVGLRKETWINFVDRFKIPKVVELYGSTEGTVGTFNNYNRPGSVGFLSHFFRFPPFGLIRIDPLTGKVQRNSNGLCIRCKAGETGEIIGVIRPEDRGGPRHFNAYVNAKSETSKKLIENVFDVGDVAFRTGDLMQIDEDGWLYFVDRIGDNYRWRGENVSTSEVESVIGNILDDHTKSVVVYGVAIPGIEGKAGMTAILDPEETINLVHLAEEIRDKLPYYSRPLFLRLLKNEYLTGTYKLMKRNLQNEGFDTNIIHDKLFYMGPKDKYYQPFDKNSFDEIINTLL